MQNIDYSKKLSQEKVKKRVVSSNFQTPRNFNSFPIVSSQESSNSFLGLVSQQSQPLSILYLFIGAILFFTSGLIVGMKIDQKEAYFSNNTDTTSFRNVVTEVEKKEETGEVTPTKTNLAETKSGIFSKKSLSSVPQGLVYQPVPNKVNYIIHVGSFSPSDAKKWGKYLIRQKQDFQGRLFKTVSGKLYIGYYYEKEDVRKALKQVQVLNESAFSNASIKKVQF
jgi:hypothetical protein